MTKNTHKCPLCESSLPKAKFNEVNGIWKNINAVKKAEIIKVRKEERKKAIEQIQEKEAKIKEKKAEIIKVRTEERKRANDKINKFKKTEAKKTKKLNERIKLLEQAQVGRNEIDLGFELERETVDKLKEMFPEDVIDNTGKMGDILHTIKNNEQEIGAIIYECKRTKTHSLSHIAQTRKAMAKRNADYGILVTKGEGPKNFKGFSIEKGRVYVVRPAAVIVFATLLRNYLLEINKRKIPKNKRHQAADRALRFLKSKDFESPLKEVLENLENNKTALEKEVRDHVKYWNNRIKNYQSNSKYIEFVIQNSIKSIKGESLLKDPLSLKAKEVILLPYFKKKKVV